VSMAGSLVKAQMQMASEIGDGQVQVQAPVSPVPFSSLVPMQIVTEVLAEVPKIAIASPAPSLPRSALPSRSAATSIR
jgi:hypothetical protein